MLRCEVNSSKEKQAEIKRFVDEVKDSVDYAHARTDALELKSYKLDVDFKEAKEDLRKKILYLETYSRRENLKFSGIPEVNSDQEDTKNVLTNFAPNWKERRPPSYGYCALSAVCRQRKNYEKRLQTEEHRFHDL